MANRYVSNPETSLDSYMNATIRVPALLFSLLCLIMSAGCGGGGSNNTRPARPIYNVTVYAGDGTVLKVWENITEFNTWSTNNRVNIVEPSSGKTAVAFGTVVIQQTNTRDSSWLTKTSGSQSKTWSVKLYGGNGKEIRIWTQVTEFQTWSENDRIDFVDSENRTVIVFGTVIATPN